MTAFGAVEVRGAGSDAGSGDLTLGVRHSLLGPDGSGTAVAVQAFVALPTGTGPFDSDEWSAGLAIPASFELGPAITFAMTPQLALLPDADGAGRHLAFGSAAGFAAGLTETLSASADIAVTRDDDPGGSTTQAAAGLSFAWQASADIQLDLGAAAGLNRDTPDLELYAGVVTRF